VVTPFGDIEYIDVQIEHRKMKSDNGKRNLNIYNRHLKLGEKLSTRDTYYYAKEYYYLCYYVSAEKFLKRFIKMSNCYVYDLIDSYITLYDIAVKLKRNNPQKYLFACLERCGANSELLCKIADHYVFLGQIERAIDYYKFALSCKKPKGGFVKNEYYFIYPLLQLTYFCYKVGDIKSAYEYHKTCVKEDCINPSVLYNENFFSKENFSKK
jgi:tetratricopeptide (TPR) repeat protein